jgi:hypothetical protein
VLCFHTAKLAYRRSMATMPGLCGDLIAAVSGEARCSWAVRISSEAKK